jgi:small subunit ribosomal protein S8
MALSDPIADFLTRIRNAQMAKHRVVDIPHSRLKQSITEILYDQGYIHRYKVEEDAGPQGLIRIALKYDKMTGIPVIKKLGRFSRPGLRQYARARDIPRVMNGLGIAIISTSQGIMTGKKARSENVGGEVLCYVY